MHTPDIDWEFPLSQPKKDWYNKNEYGKRVKRSGYLRDLRKEWQNLDCYQLGGDFRDWLKQQKRHEWDGRVVEDESEEIYAGDPLVSIGYGVGDQSDSRQETLDWFFQSEKYSAEFGHAESALRLEKMVQVLSDNARGLVQDNTSKNANPIRNYGDDLEYLRKKYYDTRFHWFPWPSIDAPGGAGEMGDVDMPDHGLFAHVGYHTYKTEDERREILDWVFHNDLPPVHSDAYMAEFDSPRSPVRLHKMANFLAAQARNCSRNRTKDYMAAVNAYKTDLGYLYGTYYVGHFGFDNISECPFIWPDLSFLPDKSTKKPTLSRPKDDRHPKPNTHLQLESASPNEVADSDKIVDGGIVGIEDEKKEIPVEVSAAKPAVQSSKKCKKCIVATAATILVVLTLVWLNK